MKNKPTEIGGYTIWEAITLDGRDYVQLTKKGESFFYRLKNRKYLELTKKDQEILFNHLGTLVVSPPKNTTVVIHYNYGSINKTLLSSFLSINDAAVSMISDQENTVSYYIKNKGYLEIAKTNKKTIHYKHAITAVILLTTLLAIKDLSFSIAHNYNNLSTPIPIEDNVEFVSSKPISNDAVINTISENTIEELIINHEICDELKPHFERFIDFMESYFADYTIGKETNRPIIFVVETENYFAENMPYAIAYYTNQNNSIHFKTLGSFFSIYHELIHERTINFSYAYGSLIKEATTSLLAKELFCDNIGYSYESQLLKILIEVLGYDYTILPFINNGTIDDIINAIDNETNIDGYGKNLINLMDSHMFSRFVKDEVYIPNTYLSESQIELINLYFIHLENNVNKLDITDIINKAYNLKYLLITDNNASDIIKERYLDLYKVREYYENRKADFFKYLTSINTEYSILIKNIENSVDDNERQQYYNNKKYIYQGEYINQYYIHESYYSNGTSNIQIKVLKVAKESVNENQSVIYHKTVYNENGEINEFINFDNINNYELYQKLLNNYNESEHLEINLDEFGFIKSAWTIQNKDKIELPLDKMYGTVKYYPIMKYQNIDGTYNINVQIIKDFALIPFNYSANKYDINTLYNHLNLTFDVNIIYSYINKITEMYPEITNIDFNFNYNFLTSINGWFYSQSENLTSFPIDIKIFDKTRKVSIIDEYIHSDYHSNILIKNFDAISFNQNEEVNLYIKNTETFSDGEYNVDSVISYCYKDELNTIIQNIIDKYPKLTNFEYRIDKLGNITSIKTYITATNDDYTLQQLENIPLETIAATDLHYNINETKKLDGSIEFQIEKINTIRKIPENKQNVTYYYLEEFIRNEEVKTTQLSYKYLTLYDLDIEMLEIINNFPDAVSITYYLNDEQITKIIIENAEGEKNEISFTDNNYKKELAMY